MDSEKSKIDLPETRKLIEEHKNNPTVEERLTAIEDAFIEMLLGDFDNV